MRLLRFQNKKFHLICYCFSLIIIIVDQYTKYLISLRINDLYLGVQIFPFLDIVYVINKGISFGIFSELNISFYLGIMSLVISVFIVLWIWKSSMKIEMISLSFVLGGAIGNGIDRIINSFVIDFIDFHWSNFHWPAFNFADTFITTGALIYVLSSFTKKTKIKKLK
jgi:signal peptidase II